jgi:hypothetical protein
VKVNSSLVLQDGAQVQLQTWNLIRWDFSDHSIGKSVRKSAEQK